MWRSVWIGAGALSAALGLAAAPASAADAAADLRPALVLPAPWRPLEAAQAVGSLRVTPSDDRARAVECLAEAVYYEAADQPLEGREAVAQVVLNRVRHPRYPKSVCAVVFQGAARASASAGGCQFTFACDGSRRRTPDLRGWRAAEAVAEQALDGFVLAAAGSATHYHALYVHPGWSASMTPVLQVGAHRFYSLSGGPGALTGAYAGGESGPPARTAALLLASREPAMRAAAPTAASFQVWGLPVARVTPGAGGVAVAMASAAEAMR